MQSVTHFFKASMCQWNVVNMLHGNEHTHQWYIDGLVQDCGNSSALAMELLQSCIKPSIY